MARSASQARVIITSMNNQPKSTNASLDGVSRIQTRTNQQPRTSTTLGDVTSPDPECNSPADVKRSRRKPPINKYKTIATKASKHVHAYIIITPARGCQCQFQCHHNLIKIPCQSQRANPMPNPMDGEFHSHEVGILGRRFVTWHSFCVTRPELSGFDTVLATSSRSNSRGFHNLRKRSTLRITSGNILYVINNERKTNFKHK